jgi:hypothetical protein
VFVEHNEADPPVHVSCIFFLRLLYFLHLQVRSTRYTLNTMHLWFRESLTSHSRCMKKERTRKYLRNHSSSVERDYTMKSQKPITKMERLSTLKFEFRREFRPLRSSSLLDFFDQKYITP